MKVIRQIKTIYKGINRNIVECKFFFEMFVRNPYIVLIETLWNVNFEMLQYLLRLPVY